MKSTPCAKVLTEWVFCDRLRNSDGKVISNLFSVMFDVRGSRKYFAKMAMYVK